MPHVDVIRFHMQYHEKAEKRVNFYLLYSQNDASVTYWNYIKHTSENL